MNTYEKLASELIDDICEVVEKQHPEINLNTEQAKEIGIPKDEPAVIIGEDYYNLEQEIANKLKEFKSDIKNIKTKDNDPINGLRDFLKGYDKTEEKAISIENIQKNITLPEKTLKKYITKMLEDGEIYEAKPNFYGWLG